MKYGKINTLVVEDDELYSKAIVGYFNLTKEINCINSFTNVQAALSFLAKNHLTDVILLDIGLPDIDGITAINKIKKIAPYSKIIMHTVFDDNKKIFEALRNGANGYLLKSDGEDKITTAIMEVYHGGGVFSPLIANTILNYFKKNTEAQYQLTQREIEVLKLLSKGKKKKEIAEICHVSYETVASHVKNIFSKLHVNSGIEAVVKAIEENLI